MDFWFIDKFERFSHWWQKNISGEQNCFWWAKCCLLFYTLGVIRSAVTTFYFGYTDSSLVTLWVLTLCLGAVYFRMIRIVEKTIAKLHQGGLSNPQKMLGLFRSTAILMQFISYLSLSFTVLLRLPWRWQIYIASLSIFLAATAYFTACDPLPPAKSKIRQWLGNLAKSIKVFLIPAPQSVPALLVSSNRAF